MLEFSLEDVRYDLHVSMWMHPEAHAGKDALVVENAERAPAGVLWISIAATPKEWLV